MYKCIKCGAETTFNHPYCLNCYREMHPNYDFHENMIKGRIAETLVQELFLASNFDVFHYGMETTIPGVMELLQGIKTEVAEDIRRAPDLVLHKRGTDSFYFAEVKFRKDGKFSLKDIPVDYPYHNVYFLIISKADIKCITYQELENEDEITPTSNNHLRDRKEFNLNKDIVGHFCRFAAKFFECV